MPLTKKARKLLSIERQLASLPRGSRGMRSGIDMAIVSGARALNNSLRQQPRRRRNRPRGNNGMVALYKPMPLQATFGRNGRFSQPVASTTPNLMSEPRIRAGPRMTEITHRELVATVTGTTAFAVFQSLSLNPGLAATFPWLSTQAVGWEQYSFRKLCFEYVTRSSTSATGSILLAPDYDVLDAAPSTEVVAMSYRDSTEDVPWHDQVCNLDPTAMHPNGPRKYVRSGLVANSDLKTYDVGSMHICTTGQADTAAVGKLFVCYDVVLFVPQTISTSSPLNRNFAQFNLSANQSLTTGTVATIGYDETVTNDVGIVNSTGVFTLPSGNWAVNAEVSGGGGTSNVGTALLAIEKNGAALTIPCESHSGGSLEPYLSATAYVTSAGSDTCRVRFTYTSSTGTLVATGDRCRVQFRTC